MFFHPNLPSKRQVRRLGAQLLDHAALAQATQEAREPRQVMPKCGGLGRTWYQWEFQDPKMEVLYHIRPYFVVIFTYIGLI